MTSLSRIAVAIVTSASLAVSACTRARRSTRNTPAATRQPRTARSHPSLGGS